MKKYFNLIIIAILFFSCNNDNPKIDTEKIIGQEYNINSLPYGVCGFYDNKVINGVSYFVHGVYYKNKVLVYIPEYVNDKLIIKDYFFSNFVAYNKVKDIPVGTSYEKIIEMLGEPVGSYWSENNMENNEKDGKKVYFGITYFQKEKYGKELSQLVVGFRFNYEGKLLYVNEAKVAP